MRKLKQLREEKKFEKILNKVTNQRNYKERVNEIIQHIENPITQEQIDAIIYKKENSLPTKIKKMVAKSKSFLFRLMMTIKIWVYYFHNKAFFKGFKFTIYRFDRSGKMKKEKKSFKRRYTTTLNKAAMVLRLTTSVKNFDDYLLKERKFRY